MNIIILLAVTWLALVLIYPAIRLWTLSDDAFQQWPPDERNALMQKSAIAGIDLRGGYRFRLLVDVSKFTERGRENAMNQLVEILRNRLVGMGIIEFVIRSAEDQTIVVEVPASADTLLIRRLLTQTGLLTFRLFKDGNEAQELRQKIDAALARRAAGDSAGVPSPSITPFSDMLSSLTLDNGIADIVVEERWAPAVRALLADSTVQQVVRAFSRAKPPAGMFVWASEPVERNGRRFYPLYFVNQEPALVGNPLRVAQVSEASRVTAAQAPYAVRVMLNDEGREDLTNVSSANIGKRLAIGLNDEILTTLTIQGKIPDGRAEIPGGKTIAEASTRAIALRTGVLPIPVTMSECAPIGPTIEGGARAVRTGIQAGLIGLILVSILLIVVYRGSGAVAVLGLLFHVMTTGAILRLWIIAGITPELTLSGVVGLTLSVILMAGAHILLFERIREELAAQLTPKVAVADAFDLVRPVLIWMHSVILILALVFISMGTGPILDGALALFSGAAASLLTVMLMTRTILMTVITEWNLARLSV